MRHCVHTTSASLLERLKQPAAQESWTRFVDLYTPLLFYWGRRLGLQETDAADLVQDVFALLVKKLPRFNYQRDLSFRGWLRTVMYNEWRKKRAERLVTDAALSRMADPAPVADL